jgi:hypothetical protein
MKRFTIFITIVLLGDLLAFQSALAATHPAGTNVISSGTVFMITADGQRRPYTSAGAFLSYGFNTWAGVQQAASEDLALPVGSFIPPRDGKIICSDRGADKGTCYLITNGKKAGFVSAQVFQKLGFSFSKTTMGDVSFMESDNAISDSSQSHKPGTLINKNGTIYLILSNGLSGVPSMDVLNSWGYSLADAITANISDSQLPQSYVMTGRQGAELMPSTYFDLNQSTPPKTSGSTNLMNGSYPANGIISGGCFSVDPNNDQYLKINQTTVNINNQTFTIPQQSFLLNINQDSPGIYIINNLPGEGSQPKIQFSVGTAGASYQNYGFMVGSLKSQSNHIFAITHSQYNRVGTALQCADYQKTNTATNATLAVSSDPSLQSVTIDNTTNPKPWYTTIAKFTLTATGGDVVITKMTFSANIAKGSISSFNIVDSQKQQAIALLSGGSGDDYQTSFVTDTYSDGFLLIPQNTSRTIEIQANFSSYAKSANFKVGISSLVTKQGLSGTTTGLPAYSANVTLKGLSTNTTAPAVSIVSPHGGEVLTKGSTVTITWTGGFADGKDEIRLISSDNYPTQMIEGNYSYFGIKSESDISSSANSYSWTIDNNILPGKYFIRILREDPATLEATYYADTSSYITIQ